MGVKIALYSVDAANGGVVKEMPVPEVQKEGREEGRGRGFPAAFGRGGPPGKQRNKGGEMITIHDANGIRTATVEDEEVARISIYGALGVLSKAGGAIMTARGEDGKTILEGYLVPAVIKREPGEEKKG
jgi:hypothetical protein